jgi:hypothetical protein
MEHFSTASDMFLHTLRAGGGVPPGSLVLAEAGASLELASQLVLAHSAKSDDIVKSCCALFNRYAGMLGLLQRRTWRRV